LTTPSNHDVSSLQTGESFPVRREGVAFAVVALLVAALFLSLGAWAWIRFTEAPLRHARQRCVIEWDRQTCMEGERNRTFTQVTWPYLSVSVGAAGAGAIYLVTRRRIEPGEYDV
jgi:hypothetical protein